MQKATDSRHPSWTSEPRRKRSLSEGCGCVVCRTGLAGSVWRRRHRLLRQCGLASRKCSWERTKLDPQAADFEPCHHFQWYPLQALCRARQWWCWECCWRWWKCCFGWSPAAAHSPPRAHQYSYRESNQASGMFKICSLLAHSHLAVSYGIDTVVRTVQVPTISARLAARALDLACMTGRASVVIISIPTDSDGKEETHATGLVLGLLATAPGLCLIGVVPAREGWRLSLASAMIGGTGRVTGKSGRCKGRGGSIRRSRPQGSAWVIIGCHQAPPVGILKLSPAR